MGKGAASKSAPAPACASTGGKGKGFIDRVVDNVDGATGSGTWASGVGGALQSVGFQTVKVGTDRSRLESLQAVSMTEPLVTVTVTYEGISVPH